MLVSENKCSRAALCSKFLSPAKKLLCLKSSSIFFVIVPDLFSHLSVTLEHCEVKNLGWWWRAFKLILADKAVFRPWRGPSCEVSPLRTKALVLNCGLLPLSDCWTLLVLAICLFVWFRDYTRGLFCFELCDYRLRLLLSVPLVPERVISVGTSLCCILSSTTKLPCSVSGKLS